MFQNQGNYTGSGYDSTLTLRPHFRPGKFASEKAVLSFRYVKKSNAPKPTFAYLVSSFLSGMSAWDFGCKIQKGHNMAPMNVIIVDDHAAVRKSLRLLLESDPALKLVGEATDGLEAIRTVHALQPDLLLLDIKMPQMNGLEVLQYLRNEKNPVAIIIFSNHSDQLYVEAALRLGAAAFVSKSAGMDALMDAIYAVRASLPAANSPDETVFQPLENGPRAA